MSIHMPPGGQEPLPSPGVTPPSKKRKEREDSTEEVVKKRISPEEEPPAKKFKKGEAARIEPTSHEAAGEVEEVVRRVIHDEDVEMLTAQEEKAPVSRKRKAEEAPESRKKQKIEEGPERLIQDMQKRLSELHIKMEETWGETLKNLLVQKKELREKVEKFTTTGDVTYLRLCLVTGETSPFEEILSQFDSMHVPARDKPLKLRQFGHIFGDSYLFGTGLEGDQSCSVYFDLLTQFLQQNHHPLADYFGSNINVSKAESGGELRSQVQEAINQRGRCCFAGGWQKHGITYELIKQPDGKFTFRVYNAGEGAERQEWVRLGYKSKISGMTEIRDIPEQNLFRESFWGSLIQLRKIPRTAPVPPKDVLFDVILPQLQGKFIIPSPDIDALLSPQRSGTCTYRSVLALLAKTMPKEEYKLLKFHFKLFCLDHFLPRLQQRLLLPISEKTYQKQRRLAFVVERGIEKFAAAIKKLEPDLSAEGLTEAKKRLRSYEKALGTLQNRIQEYEKQSAVTLAAMTATPNPIPVASLAVEPFPKSLGAVENRQFVQCIKSISEVELGNYQSLQKALTSVLDIPKQLYPEAVDALCRKIGSYKNFANITFQKDEDRAECLGAIDNVIKRLGAEISLEMLHNGQMLAMIDFLFAGYEQLFLTLPESVRIFRKCAIVQGYSYHFKEFRVSDPFWVNTMQELTELGKTTSLWDNQFWHWNLFTPGWGYKKGEIEYWLQPTHAYLIEDFKRQFTEKPEIEKGIQAVVDIQRRKVESELRESGEEKKKKLDAAIIECEKKIESLEAELKGGKAEHLEKELQESREQLLKHKNFLNRIPSLVARGIKEYAWPGNWKEHKTSYQMAFLFANWSEISEIIKTRGELLEKVATNAQEKEEMEKAIQNIENAFSPLFSQYCNLAIHARNLLYKADDKELQPYQSLGMEGEYEHKVQVTGGNASSRKQEVILNFDPYLSDIRQPAVQNLYSLISEKRIDDGDIAQEAQKHAADPLSFSKNIDDYKRLLGIRSCQETQFYSTLNYFQDHIDRLDDPDWVKIFHALLFEGDILVEEIEKRPRTVSQLQEFFTEQIERALGLENVLRAMQLMWIASKVEHFARFLGKKEHVLSLDTVKRVVEAGLNKKYESNRGILGETLLATMGNLHGPQEELVAYQQLGTILKNQHQIPVRLQIRERAKEADHAKLQGEAKASLLDEKQKQEMMRQLTLLLKQAFEDFDTIDLATGYVAKQGALVVSQDQPIPYSFLESPQLQELIPREELETKGCRFHDKTNSQVIIVADPSRKREILATQDGSKIKLFVQSKGEWLYLHPKDTKAALCPTEFFKQFDIAQRGETVHFYDRSTGELRYVVEKETLLKADRSQSLVKAKNEHAEKLTRELSLFEDKNFILLWGSPGSSEIQTIELPRQNLEFSLKNGKWECRQMEGWNLATVQYLPGFGPEEGFLVLENEKTKQKKVLFPDVPAIAHDLVRAEDNQELFLAYKHNLKAVEKLDRLTYHEYLVDARGRISPQTLSGRYALANIYLTKGLLSQAETLLFDTQAECTFRPYTKEEKELLSRIIEQPMADRYSRAQRLRLHLLYLLVRNVQQFPEGKSERIEKLCSSIEMQTAFEKYLGALKHLRPLDPREEQMIIPQLTSSKLLQTRLNELTANQEPENERLELLRLSRESTKTRKDPEEMAKQLFSIAKCTNIPDSYRASYASRSFDPTQFSSLSPEEQDFYGRLLLEECPQLTEKEAIKQGIYQTLLYFHLSDHPKARVIGDVGLFEIYSRRKFIQACEGVQSEQNLYRVLRDEYREVSIEIPKMEEREVTRPLLKKVPKKEAPQPVATPYDLSFLHLERSTDVEKQAPAMSKRYFEEKPVEQKKALQAPAELISQAHPEADEAVVRAEFERVREELELAAAQEARTEYFLLPGYDTGNVRQELTLAAKEQREKLDEMGKVLENTVATLMRAGAFLATVAKQRITPTIEELVILAVKEECQEKIFKSKEKSVLQERIPELNSAGIRQLRSLLKEYLAQKLIVQQLERSERLTEGDEQLQLLARTMAQETAYKDEDPDAMLFQCIEATLDLRLREDQVANIRLLLRSYGVSNEVLQMIMGAGKTTVIQPLLAILLARPGTISGVVVPQTLYETVRQILSSTLGSAFQTLVFSMDYNRDRAKESDFLQRYLEKLQEVEERGGCLLMIPEQLHSIVTSLYEAYYDNDTARIDQISKICSFLKTKANVQIDEIDMVMNPQIIFKFPVGAQAAVDQERAECVSELVMRLVQDKELASKISFDFATQFQEKNKEATALTEQSFKEIVKPKLKEYAIAMIKERFPSLSELTAHAFFSKFLLQPTPFDAAEKKEMREWLEAHIPDARVRDILGVLTHAINTPSMLQETLLKKCGAHYGRQLKDEVPVPGNFVARPYEAPRKSKTTMFADPYEQVLHSVQNYLYEGIPREAIPQMLTILQNQAYDEFKKKGLKDISQAAGYQSIARVLGEQAKDFALMKAPPSQELVEAFYKASRYDIQMLKRFFNDFVFRQIYRFPYEISSTPQALVGTTLSTIGYTGTLHPEILHISMTAHPEKGTDGKTLRAVQKKIEQGIGGVVLCSQEVPLLDQVKRHFQTHPDTTVFIDSGGWLKDTNVDAFAKELLACTKKRGVVVHNSKGACMSWEPDERGVLVQVPLQLSKLKPEERVTIITQSYETGTNIPQSPTAKCFMSVRKGMTLRDFLQSVFRMRQILLDQAVFIGLSDEVQQHMKSGHATSLDFGALLRYFTANLARVKLQKHEDAVKGRMGEVLINAVNIFLHQQAIPREERQKLFSYFSPLLVRKTEERLFDAVTREQLFVGPERGCELLEENILRSYDNFVRQALAEGNHEIIKKFNVIFLQAYPSAEKEIKQRMLELLKKCSSDIELPALMQLEGDAGRELEQQVEQQIEQQVQHELFAGQIPKQTGEPLVKCEQKTIRDRWVILTAQRGLVRNIEYPDDVFYNLDEFATLGRSLPSATSLVPPTLRHLFAEYDKSLFFSPNFLFSKEPLTDPESGQYHRTAEFCALCREPSGGQKIIVLSDMDTAALKNSFLVLKEKKEYSISLLSLRGEVIASTDGPVTKDTRVQDEEVKRALTIIKFLNGQLDYSNAEQEQLRIFLMKGCRNKEEAAERTEAIERFAKQLVTFQPGAAARFAGSDLQHLVTAQHA